jgi:quercetin dioxygenase-like cupin family protein
LGPDVDVHVDMTRGRLVRHQGVNEIMQADAVAHARVSSASTRFAGAPLRARRLDPASRRHAAVRGARAALAVFAAGIGIAFSGAVWAEQPQSQPATGIKIETLLKTDKSWDGTPYKVYPSGQPQLTVLKIEVPAHSVLPWHTHPMPNAGYVLSGELTVEKENGEKQTVKTGQVLPETVGSVHRGTTGDSPVTLIVFYAGTPGMPLSQHP